MLRVVLVDDESLARQGLRHLLAAHSDIAIVGEAASAAAAAALIQREKPAAVFLDIHMPRAGGFELLAGLEHPPKVIFVTAHSEHAVRAFEVDAVDYLLKPVHPHRLADALRRLQAACHRTPEATPYQGDDRICLRTPQKTLISTQAEIIALEAEGDFTRFHVAGEHPLLICQTLSFYEKTLPEPPFIRLSRSLMINATRLARIESVSRDEGRLFLRGLAAPIPIGRRVLARLKKEST